MVWGDAPAADAQITRVPATSTLHGAILDRSFDPENLPNAQAWASSITTAAINDIVLMRVRNGMENLLYRYSIDGEPEPIYEHSQLPNADENWTYFNLGQFAAGLVIALQKRQNLVHGIWKGELGGPALEQVLDSEGPAVSQLQGLTSELQLHDHSDWANVAGSGLTPEADYGLYVIHYRYGGGDNPPPNLPGSYSCLLYTSPSPRDS